MFDNVVVGIDGEAGGRDALALATELAAPGAALNLANVYFGNEPPARAWERDLDPGRRGKARELLAGERAKAGIDGNLCPVASPLVGRGLHELADGIGADLIVVGSSRHGLLGRVLLGDDMRSALNGAPCAVAVAPVDYADRPRVLAEIGVGYDGSPESQVALTVARELAARHAARVSVFQAVAIQPPGFAGAHLGGGQTLDDQVELVYDRISALGDVDAHAAYGDPAEELALYAASVDLLVIGSRGYGPVGRLIHGSTSMSLASSCRSPLLVLPKALVPAGTTQSEDEHVTTA